MSKLWIECENCGAKSQFEDLRDRRWKCPDCDATLEPAPSEKQLHYAQQLGIDEPESLTSRELSDAIKAALSNQKDMETSEREEQHRREMEYLQSRRNALPLAEATIVEMLEELFRRNIAIVALVNQRPGDTVVEHMEAIGTFRAEELNKVVHKWAFHHATGSLRPLPRRRTQRAG